MPRVIESREEFIERHGGLPLVPLGRGAFLLASGARLQETEWGTSYAEPPEDAEERLELRKQYHQTLKDKAEEAFRQLKEALAPAKSAEWEPKQFRWAPGTDVERFFGPAPSSDGAECLTFLRDRYRQYANAVADLDRQYARLPSVVEQRKRLRAEVEERERIDAAVAQQRQRELDTINSVTL